MNEIKFNTGVIRPVECMREGWELIKDQFWLFFAITLVGIIIAGSTMYYFARGDVLRDLLLSLSKNERTADKI